MIKRSYKFNHSVTNFLFDLPFSKINEFIDAKNIVIVTDDIVFKNYQKKFKSFKTIIIKSGEENKNQKSIDLIIKQLINFRADRNTILLGIGGGMITDLTGFVAAIYMRGLRFAFVPTTLLAMTDAAIGGKNGINAGIYKNIIGTTKQPEFIFYDFSFLKTLSSTEWQNGFAEIIKHACIRDEKMFHVLQSHSLKYYQKNKKELSHLIQQNVKIKVKIVQKDELEQNERKLLNFGHTIGHAIEKQNRLPHGHAITHGMVYASKLSNKLTNFEKTDQIINLLKKYNLPTSTHFNSAQIIKNISMDKKRNGDTINFILLDKIGKGIIYPINISDLKKWID